jgi:hypothetical protein
LLSNSARATVDAVTGGSSYWNQRSIHATFGGRSPGVGAIFLEALEELVAKPEAL